MMWLRPAARAGVLAVLIGSMACGGSASTPAPTAPSVASYTDVFTGTVTQGAVDYGGDASANHFTVHQVGNLTATLTKIGPLSTITLGMDLGVFDTASGTCQVQLQAPAATLNLVLNASVSIAGEFCIGVRDVGNIGETPVTYEVTVIHT
jgi:hypothetical protein